MLKKIRKRYILYKVLTEKGEINKDNIQKIIAKAIYNLFGLKGLIEVSPKNILYDSSSKLGIVQCNHFSINKLFAALMIINEIDNKKIIIDPIKTSGLLSRVIKYVKEKKCLD
ncbi:MAG: Rpp14/Pop5 family protein [Nitrososphaerota archaeon]